MNAIIYLGLGLGTFGLICVFAYLTRPRGADAPPYQVRGPSLHNKHFKRETVRRRKQIERQQRRAGA